MKRAYIIGTVLVIAFAALGFTQFKSMLTPYVGFSEARASEQRVQLKGAIDKKSVKFDREANELVFDVTDEQGQRLTIKYAGAQPGNFNQASHVVAAGKHKGDYFEADELLIKCPSKYKGQSYSGDE